MRLTLAFTTHTHTQILCLYGYWRNFEWVSPAYTVSMLMVLICTGTAASFGFVAEHPKWRGQMLIGLFFVVAIVQYFFASPSSLVV